MFSYMRAVKRVQGLFLVHLRSPRLYFYTDSLRKMQAPSEAEHTEENASNTSSNIHQVNDKLNNNSSSSIQRKLTPEAQRAYWAWQIIHKIKEADPPKQIKTSLRDEILKMMPNTTEYQLQDVHKNEVMKMFTTGVFLNPDVFNQVRILSAIVKDKIPFFPTYTVTSPIFNQLQNRQMNILTGSFGIGKTFSLICYIVLSKHVNRLKYLAIAPWVPQQIRAKHFDQYHQLLEKGLIEPVKKCWYWTKKRGINEKQSEVKKIILNQTDQMYLSKSLRQQLQSKSSLNEIIQTFNKHYKIGDESFQKQHTYESTAIIDQINVVTSYFRIFNTANPKLIMHKYHLNENYHNISDFIEGRIKQGERMKFLIEEYVKFGINFFLNSSYHLEEQLICKMQNSQSQIPRLHLDLVDHGDILRQNICISKKLQQEESKQYTKLEYIQFLLFLLEVQHGSTHSVIKANINAIKNNTKPQDFIVKNYSRFLFVRQYIKSNKTKKIIKQQFKNMQNIQVLKKFINIFTTDMNNSALQQAQKKLEKYIFKDTDIEAGLLVKDILSTRQKKQLLRLIYTEAMICKRNNKQYIQISVRKLQQLLRLLTGRDFLNFNEILEKGSNLEIFPFSYIQNKAFIRLDWNPVSFIQISQRILFPQKLIKFINNIPISKLWIYDISSSSLGIDGEKIMLWLIMYSTEVRLEIYNEEKKLQFPLYAYADFQAFNRNYTINKEQIISDNNKRRWRSLISFKRNLKDLISLAHEKPDMYLYGFPKNKDEKTGQQKHAENSLAIDFLIMKYVSEEKIYKINTFDMGIQKAQYPKQAEQLFKQLLRKVRHYNDIKSLQKKQKRQDNDGNKSNKYISLVQSSPDDNDNYSVTHTIITPRVFCEPKTIIEPKIFQINYCPLQVIQFVNCSDPQAQEIFEDIRKIIILRAESRIFSLQ